MNIENSALLLLPKVYAVEVSFHINSEEYSASTYTYLSLEPVKQGDFVVVSSKYSDLTVCVVRSCKLHNVDIHASYEYKFIVQKIDLDSYYKRQERYVELKEEVKADIHKNALAKAKKALGLRKTEKLSKLVDKLRNTKK